MDEVACIGFWLLMTVFCRMHARAYYTTHWYGSFGKEATAYYATYWYGCLGKKTKAYFTTSWYGCLGKEGGKESDAHLESLRLHLSTPLNFRHEHKRGGTMNI